MGKRRRIKGGHTTIAQAFNEITEAQGGTPNNGGTIAGAIDALNDTLAGSDQKPAQTIEGAIRLLGAHIGGGGDFSTATVKLQAAEGFTGPLELTCPCIASDEGLPVSTNTSVYTEDSSMEFTAILYKGKALAHNPGFGINLAATGSVESGPGILTYTITGDCTFTFSE